MKLQALKVDPYRYLEHHEGSDFYKLRVGDYRALLDVDNMHRVRQVPGSQKQDLQ
jgi:mRNA-degrading endonuclease RelE of RelBE toxin-antitoxin system